MSQSVILGGDHSVATAIYESWPGVTERKAKKRYQGKIYPSTLVLGCDLVCYYDLIRAPAIPESRDPESIITMDVGSFMHDKLQEGLAKWYAEKGWTYWPEVRLKFSENSSGKCDAYVIAPNAYTEAHEYKTCSASVFDSLTKSPKEDNEDQLQLYMSKLHCERGRVVYFNRNNSKIKEFVVPFKPERAAKIQARIDKIELAAMTGVPPDPNPGWWFTSACTKVCPYRKICPAGKSASRRKL